MTNSTWRRWLNRINRWHSSEGNRNYASGRLPAARHGRARLALETLEARDLPTVLFPTHQLLFQPDGITPLATAGPTGYTPTQMRHAYGFDQINLGSGVSADGSGTTIAIVDAYDNPTIASDLHQFDLQFGLPDPTFTKVNETGGTTLPAANASWAQEIALDVEWAHAIAPKAGILLVEANSTSSADLYPALNYAAKQPGVVAVSMSWGGGEYSGETNDDSNFKTPSGHQGVAFVVASGDAGAPAEYPSSSPNVLSVGGTTLNLSSGNYGSETGWSGSGGGISAYENQPYYQKGIVTQSTTRRTTPDVAYDANPNSGVPVYITYNNSTSTPWIQFGGTSAAAPQWCALIAIADQGRALHGQGLGSLDTATLLSMLYQLPASDFHDITSGTSTGSPNYTAAAGYDLVTGRGTPIANLVVPGLIGTTSTAPAAATFVKTDTTTAGSWQGAYGTAGYTIAQGAAALPAYAQVALSGQSNYTWASSTTDVRALQKPGASDRLASCWYGGSFTLDVNLTDGQAHQVGLYLLDWDRLNRSERVDVLDAGNPNTVLVSGAVSSFGSGEYLVWTLSGHVLLRVTNTGNAAYNAVASALFFDPKSGTPLPQADLAVALTDNVTAVSPGGPVTYTLTVSNSGPSAVTGAAVADTVPALLSGVSYTALGAGGASGFASGSGSISQTVNLPAGASVTYTITATVSSAATGSLVNTATVTAPAGVTDPNLANNSVTDTDSVTISGVQAAAAFVRTDTTTAGSWQGAYGTAGYTIAQGAAALPAYAQVALSGQSSYTWAASTTDARALQKPVAPDRLASCWYGGSFTLDVNLTDGQAHQVGLYLLDWDRLSRSERVDVLDAGNPNTVLDSRAASGFGGGEYLVWTLSGHVLLRITNTGNAAYNAVASALFFGTASSPALAAQGLVPAGTGLLPLSVPGRSPSPVTSGPTVRSQVPVAPVAGVSSASAPASADAPAAVWSIPDWWFLDANLSQATQQPGETPVEFALPQ